MSAPRAALIAILGALAVAACHETAPPTAPAFVPPYQWPLPAASPGEVLIPCPIESKPLVPAAAELREKDPRITDDEIELVIAAATEAGDEVVNGALIVTCSRPATPADRAGSSAPSSPPP
jgi:hypothetical protein